MPGCHDMKKGETYACTECGFEIKVTKECKEFGKGADECGCSAVGDTCCDITCCGKPLVKK
jgi:hypothetical protein